MTVESNDPIVVRETKSLNLERKKERDTNPQNIFLSTHQCRSLLQVPTPLQGSKMQMTTKY